MTNGRALVLTGSSWIPFPLSSSAAEGTTTGVITSSIMTGVLADMLTGTGVTLGAAEGPKIALGGEISREEILPLRVILLVPAMFPMSEVSSSELSSVDSICLIPW